MKKPDFIGLHGMAWLAAAGLVVYLFLALLIPGEQLQKLSTSLNLGVSAAIVFSWAPAAFYAIRRRAAGKNQIIIAVFTLFAVFLFVRAYIVSYNALGSPETWPDSTVIALFGYLIFLCGVLFLVAPATVEGQDTDYPLKWSLLLGFVTGGFAYWAQLTGWLN